MLCLARIILADLPRGLRDSEGLEMINIHGGNGQIFQVGTRGVQAVTQRDSIQSRWDRYGCSRQSWDRWGTVAPGCAVVADQNEFVPDGGSLGWGGDGEPHQRMCRC